MQVPFLVFIVPRVMLKASAVSFWVNPLKYKCSITFLHVSPKLETYSFKPIVLTTLFKLALLSNISTKNQH